MAAPAGLLSEPYTPVPLNGAMLRMVESQEQVATSHLLDDLAEQAVLEELLEQSKPPPRPGTERLHYLLAAPFRYPPLRHGSRFGARHEPSLFYASRNIATVLAETAYYRLVFMEGMRQPPATGRLLTQHCVFKANYRTDGGVCLQRPPFDRYRDLLSDPVNYRYTQRLGTALRAAGVEVVQFVSARDPRSGLNIALFEPSALISRTPLNMQSWLCETTTDSVRFSSPDSTAVSHFPRQAFLSDGVLPQPAD